MNIVKLQKQLQNVPDNALVGYVQNPDGQVPSYLALSELNRRKQMRADYQQQTTPEKSVAEVMVEEAQPGVASLPINEQMFTAPETGIMAPAAQAAQQMPPQMAQALQPMPVQNMAQGGMVAFNDGGNVQHFYEGGYPISAPGLSEDDVAYQEALRNESVTPALGTLYDYTIGLPFNMIGKGVDYLKGRQPVWDPTQGKYVLQRDLPSVDPKVADDASFKAKMEAGLKERKDYLQSKPKAVNPAGDSQVKPAMLPYADPRVTADRNAAQIRADLAAGKYNQKQTPAAPDIGSLRVSGSQVLGSARSVSPTGIGSLYTPPTDISGEYEQLMRPEDTARAGMDKYLGLVGEDKGRIAMQERLGKMEATAAKESEQAPWLALAEAGLGMAAGTSQFAMQNIAEGGKRGIKSFVDAKDRLARAEERRFDVASRIAQAERAEQVAAATHGMQSEERAKAHNDAVKQAKLGYKAERESSIAKGNFDSKKFNLDYQLKNREIDVMSQKVDKQIKAAENQGNRYELLHQRDSLKTMLNEINDQLKTEQTAINPDPKRIADLQKNFNQAYNALYNLAVPAQSSGVPADIQGILNKYPAPKK